mgnify:CR=1 FL=1
MNESFPRILYNCPKVDSMKALEAPNSAMTHIQKIAPGPPMAMAVASMFSAVPPIVWSAFSIAWWKIVINTFY